MNRLRLVIQFVAPVAQIVIVRTTKSVAVFEYGSWNVPKTMPIQYVW